MSEQTCLCGRPTSGAALCDQCVTTLDVALANIAIHYYDLDTLRTGRARYGSTTATRGSVGKTQPLPIDGRFTDLLGAGSEVAYATRNTVTTWVRVALDTWPPTDRLRCDDGLCARCAEIRRREHPADTVGSCCTYLARMLRHIAGADWAPELLDEVLDVERRLCRLVDRPADRWYAGKCSASDDTGTCTAELYATTDTGIVSCPACGTVHGVAERREFLLAEAAEYQVTATEAAGALLAWTDYGGTEAKLVDRIRRWRDRGRLEVADVTSLLGKDRHLFRLGDIQTLLIGHAQSEQERRITA